VTVADFRARFPEFTDATKYPDAQIQFYLDLAAKVLPALSWNDWLDDGTGLFVAHNVWLARATANGQAWPPGMPASKAVGSVSVSYNTGAFVIADAGTWNITSYGARFYQLVRLVGANAVQQLPGCLPPGTLLDAP
jgi:hypothetical protein